MGKVVDGAGVGAGAVLVSRELGREQAVSRLLGLDGRGELTTEHVRLVASSMGVSLRSVWRWLEVARTEGRMGPRARERFTITRGMHARLALWCGNAAAVHRELLAEAAAARAEGRAVPVVPSLATLHRAIRRDLGAGQRAALAGGERARRRHDVRLRRPRQWRNACWEADHKHVPVEVALEGELVFPWVTWFIDCATNAVTGVAVTPHQPSRDAILAALRIALSRSGPYGPVGGLPGLVRIDRGKDFLSATVQAALGAFAVPVQDLPPYRPDLKGTVENLNLCAQAMLFASMPRYTHAPTATPRPRPKIAARGGEEPLAFTAFVELLLDWVRWWNTEHTCQPLGGVTPLAAWEADLTPVEDVDEHQLWEFTLADDGRVRTLTTGGVRWRNRYYIGDWMTGKADAGMKVRVRYVPHHDHEIEVFDAASGTYLGPAHLADEATAEQRAALRRSRDTQRRRLARALAEASRLRRERYAAVTEAGDPKRLGAVTAAEAGSELAQLEHEGLAALALPDLIPPAAPPDGWRTPALLAARTVPHLIAPAPSAAPGGSQQPVAHPTKPTGGAL